MKVTRLLALSALPVLLALSVPVASFAQPAKGGKGGVTKGSPPPPEEDPAAKGCIEAYEQVQTLRDGGQLSDARERAIECARDVCPKVLSTECAQWLDQIAQSMPTVVLGATLPDGQDITAVSVTVDKHPLAQELGARSLAVDPGTHVFVFESKEHGTVEMKVVLREGEKNRRVVAAFEKKDAKNGPLKPKVTRPVPAATWVLGGVGVLGIVGGTVFESLGLVKKGELDKCKPHCAASDVNAMSRNFVVGDVALSIGVVSLAAGALVYLTRPEMSEPAKTSRIPDITIVPASHGGFASYSTRF